MTQGYGITKETGKRIANLLNQTPFIGSDRGGNLHNESHILVRNTFASAIPAYSVLQPVAVFWLQGSVPVIDVTQYDGTYEGEFLFSGNRTIEVDAIGLAQSGRVVRCFFADGDGSIGSEYRPQANSWLMESGGSYVMACGETGNTGEMMGIITGGGLGSGCPNEVPDIISAEDADYVQVIRMVDGVPTCVFAELQPVICGSTSPPSGSPSPPSQSPTWSSFSPPPGSFSDCLSEWGSDCLPNSPLNPLEPSGVDP